MSSRPYRFCPDCGAELIAQQDHTHTTRPTCPACGFVHYHDPKVAVVILVQQDEAVLLIRRGNDPQKGKWAFPAGYVDYGEDPETAAIREVAEETGLDVSITCLIGVIGPDQNGGPNHAIVLMYAAQPEGGQLQPGDDAIDAQFFMPGALPDQTERAFHSTEVLIRRWQAGEVPPCV